MDKVKIARFDSANCGEASGQGASRTFERDAAAEATIQDTGLVNGATYCYTIAPMVAGVLGPVQKKTGRPKGHHAAGRHF